MRTSQSRIEKNPAHAIHVIKASTEFLQCWCIIFEDMNIFLSAIFILRSLICSRNLWITQIPCNNNNYFDYRGHGTKNDRLEPSVSMQKSVLKNIHRVLRYWQKYIWVVQRFLLQATKSDKKNENGAQKNVHIFKINAPTLLKLGVGFNHMYTKGWIFLDPAV